MEVWDVYNSRGEKTGRTQLRSEPIKPGDYHMVVENWIKNSRGEYLIQKRNKPLREYLDPWSTTAGSAESGEDSLTAVQRETEEEMGLSFNPSDFQFIERCFFEDFFMDVYISYWDGDSKDINFDPVEVTAVKWVTAAEIKVMFDEGLFFSHQTRFVKGIVQTPAGSKLIL